MAQNRHSGFMPLTLRLSLSVVLCPVKSSTSELTPISQNPTQAKISPGSELQNKQQMSQYLLPAARLVRRYCWSGGGDLTSPPPQPLQPPNLGTQGPNLGIQLPNLEIQGLNLGSRGPKLGTQGLNLGIQGSRDQT